MRQRGTAVAFTAMADCLAQAVTPAQALRRQRQAQLTAMADMGPVIYAVLTDDGLIKIGHTRSIHERLRKYGITARSMDRLLMVKPGTTTDELRIHALFADHLARGREYYHPVAEILLFVNTVRQQLGVPVIRQLPPRSFERPT
jgi:hypothetical protein